MNKPLRYNNRWPWMKWILLGLLFICVLFTYPVYNYIKRQQARSSLQEAGGNIRYQPEFVKLPRKLSSSDYRLPDSFSSSIDYLLIDSSIQNPDDIDHLGKLAPRAVVEFTHPAKVSPEIFHYWDGQDLSASLAMSGQDDLSACFKELSNSPFKTLTLKSHKLTVKEISALTEMKNLRTLILLDVDLEQHTIPILKEANIPYVAYLSSTRSNATAQLEQAVQFLKGYGPTDVLHWNYLPKKIFFHHQQILAEISDRQETHLAFDINNRKFKKQDAVEILNALDLTGTQLLCVDLTTLPSEFEGLLYNPNKWPNSKRDAVKAIQFQRMSTGSLYFDLNRLPSFENLEQFEYPHRHEIRNWKALAQLSSLKVIRIQNLMLTNYAHHLLNCQSLEIIDTPHGIVSYKHLGQLFEKPSLQKVVCIPKIDRSNSAIKAEVTRLCEKHDWKIINVEDEIRYTLVRNPDSKANQ